MEGGARTRPVRAPHAALTQTELDEPHAGNRFDSPLGNYGVLYFATDLRGCFGETLVRLRPDPRLVTLIGQDWTDSGFMDPAAVPADWRSKRLAVQARIPRPNLFLDIEDPTTHRILERDMAELLVVLGHREIDVPTVRGGDRRLTRWISHWAWSQRTRTDKPRYAGVRYLSRLNTDWECWAVFDHARVNEIQRRPILKTMRELRAVARHFDLTLH